MSVIVLLDNIRSAQNAGAIFRTCDGAGVSRLFLAGYTPAPVDRFGRLQSAIAKTSLGSTESVPWESILDKDVCAKLLQLKKDGYQLVAIEQAPQSISLYDYKEPKKVVYILGNEIDGVSKEILNYVDVVVELPMRGMKESLNVSVTAGIVLYKNER